ncbi:ditrans,polycis-polyprenyl diphosphate synthase [Aspergillus saccharolyticus JOP 1030-1]|uniref:ditrans,polycis-polyprenyl diphosphate synthase [(2E,6E)-farnesyldiphosphate specific] n=1 Tax=Aspergillus saccharolyticus JOP 1030-1 TaxID=1450539 RepID=A0A318ZET3_9EURO|nr:Undecaprenyl diphosphate synthase [Aspergillus saccharolyticus JOP 1030-1]PYH44794.1 Undecaprenyl diphosphate synthase [Aspergillus saccharolyticus JOP 1030-1]
MVSNHDRELIRNDIHSRGAKLSAAERENILRPYLPDPSDLRRRPSQRHKKAHRRTPVRTFVKAQIHRVAYTFVHIFFGIIYRLMQSYHAVVDRICAIIYYHHRTPELIRKDVKGLKRLPEHLSVILSLRKEEDALTVLMDEIAELAAWSASAGIPVLSVYEKTGALKSCIPVLHRVIMNKMCFYYGSPTEQPMLRLFAPHHPVFEQPQQAFSRNRSSDAFLTVLLLSATDGRETFVDLTKTLAEMSQGGKLAPQDITMELVDAEISEITTQPTRPLSPTMGEHNRTSGPLRLVAKPEPDLLLVFGSFLRLDGYPPWHIRLTEMFCTGGRSCGTNTSEEAVEYHGFLRGLWHYAGAQMRFGR